MIIISLNQLSLKTKKNKIFPVLVILILILAGFLIYSSRQRNNFGFKTTAYWIKGKKYFLLVADTEEKWAEGLMNKRKINNIDGMIFIFPDKQIRTFWNKNTYIDLKLIWMKNNQVIDEDYLQSIEKTKEIVTVTAKEPVDRVVELIVTGND